MLLHQLCEDALEIRKLKGRLQLSGLGISQYLSFGDHDYAIANQLYDLKDVRDVEDCLALRGECFEQIFEESR